LRPRLAIHDDGVTAQDLMPEDSTPESLLSQNFVHRDVISSISAPGAAAPPRLAFGRFDRPHPGTLFAALADSDPRAGPGDAGLPGCGRQPDRHQPAVINLLLNTDIAIASPGDVPSISTASISSSEILTPPRMIRSAHFSLILGIGVYQTITPRPQPQKGKFGRILFPVKLPVLRELRPAKAKAMAGLDVP
jgi:hypothetical protein